MRAICPILLFCLFTASVTGQKKPAGLYKQDTTLYSGWLQLRDNSRPANEKQSKASDNISVFREPGNCTGLIAISNSGPYIEKVELYPITGAKKDIPLKKNGREWRIDLTGLASGTYILYLYVDKAIVYRQFILG